MRKDCLHYRLFRLKQEILGITFITGHGRFGCSASGRMKGRRAENRFCQILDFAVAAISFRSRIDVGGFAAGNPCPDRTISPMITSFLIDEIVPQSHRYIASVVVLTLAASYGV
jgi:hypothetical protein